MSSSGVATLLNHRAILGDSSFISSTVTGVIPNGEIDLYYLFYCLLKYDSADILYDEGYPGIQVNKMYSIPIKLLKDNEINQISLKIKSLVDITTQEYHLKRELKI